MRHVDIGFALLQAAALVATTSLAVADEARAAISAADKASASRPQQLRGDSGIPPGKEQRGSTSDAGTAQDFADVVQSYRDAAYQGDARAQVILGVMYANGQGVRQDYLLAYTWFIRGAAGGDAAAQLNLGDMYADGHGVQADYAEAIRWYRKAADQGFVHAQNTLGSMYREGRGVPRDDVEAVKWYRKAAEQDDVRAQANLAYMYANGLGVPRDLVEACKWYSVASNRHVSSDREGREIAARERDLVIAHMTPGEVGRAQKLAREWRPR